jgi:protein involved in temperature-dependent protein secretion
MSDGLPLHSCADAILSHGEVVEAGGRFLASALISGRDHRMGEVLTRMTQGSRVVWTVMRVERSIVVPEPDGKRPE